MTAAAHLSDEPGLAVVAEHVGCRHRMHPVAPDLGRIGGSADGQLCRIARVLEEDVAQLVAAQSSCSARCGCGGSLDGGRGPMSGALSGVLMLGIVQNPTLSQVQAFWINACFGAIILISLVVSRVTGGSQDGGLGGAGLRRVSSRGRLVVRPDRSQCTSAGGLGGRGGCRELC